MTTLVEYPEELEAITPEITPNNDQEVESIAEVVCKYEETTGFDLGWDWFMSGLDVPAYDDVTTSFRQGFDYAKSTKVPNKEINRYVRKLLNLRFNAWRRGRVFDPAVTAEFLEKMDTGECLVTGQPYTHGDSADTSRNWSVDRVCNDYGYSPGNLVMISTLANQAKGSKSFEDIFKIAYLSGLSGQESFEGLTVMEWRRLALISSCVCKLPNNQMGFGIAPVVGRVPKQLPLNPSIFIQMALATRSVTADPNYDNILVKYFTKETRKRANVLMTDCRKMIKKLRIVPKYVWGNDKMFKKFVEFYNTLTEQELTNINKVLEVYNTVTHSEYPSALSCGADTNGYMVTNVVSKESTDEKDDGEEEAAECH